MKERKRDQRMGDGRAAHGPRWSGPSSRPQSAASPSHPWSSSADWRPWSHPRARHRDPYHGVLAPTNAPRRAAVTTRAVLLMAGPVRDAPLPAPAPSDRDDGDQAALACPRHPRLRPHRETASSTTQA